jgi:hypothetical protein
VRPIAVSTQGGFAGRAAALGKPNAPRAEVVLELKRALEDALGARMPMDHGSPAARLVESARHLGLLRPDELAELPRLLDDLRRLEAALVAADPRRAQRQARRIRQADLLAVSVRVQAMLQAIARTRDAREKDPDKPLDGQSGPPRAEQPPW